LNGTQFKTRSTEQTTKQIMDLERKGMPDNFAGATGSGFAGKTSLVARSERLFFVSD